MTENVFMYEFLIAFFMGIGALAIFIWAVMENQLSDTEDIKYRVLEREMDDERR